MRFATFEDAAGRERVGRVIGPAIHEIRGAGSLLALLGDDGERLQRAGEQAGTDPAAVHALGAVKLRPPIPQPPSIRDFYAFEQHVKAGRRSRGLDMIPEWYEFPVFYFTNPNALAGDGDRVAIPPGCVRMDFEVEVAAVIGRRGSNLKVSEARSHIVGYTILNDWSARDLQRKEMLVGLGPAKGKDFASSLGPCLVTADEIEARRKAKAFDLAITATVNGASTRRPASPTSIGRSRRCCRSPRAAPTCSLATSWARAPAARAASRSSPSPTARTSSPGWSPATRWRSRSRAWARCRTRWWPGRRCTSFGSEAAAGATDDAHDSPIYRTERHGGHATQRSRVKRGDKS